MAGADYRSCDVCGGKTFYDATLDYNFDAKGEPCLSGLGDWKAICTSCAQTHTVVVQARPAQAGEEWPPACPNCGQDHRDEDGEIVECRPAQAGEATVSEAEVEAALSELVVRVVSRSSYAVGELRDVAEIMLRAAARARAAAQGAGAQPVAYAIVVDGECEEIGWGATPAPDDPSNVLLYVTPPDAPRPDIEAARREERDTLAELRAAGWMVAVHNDYRLNGEAFTFWLMTHADGRYLRGEGRTDADALDAIAIRALGNRP